MAESLDPLDIGEGRPPFRDPVGRLQEAAQNGDPGAMQQYGSLLVGRGELAEGAQWLGLAVQAGDSDAYRPFEAALSQLVSESVTSQSGKGGLPEEILRVLDPASGDADFQRFLEAFGEELKKARGGSAEATKSSEEADQADEGFSVAAQTVSDLAEKDDVLGFKPLVEGLRALLNVRRTSLPLAIAVAAPWGAGKSSVMLQLREALREPADRQPQERKWWTVDFPAWKYERSERLWAALAKAIYEQPQEQMTVPQRVWFRVRVEWERLGWRRFLLKGVWPPIAAAAAVIVAFAAGSDLDSSKAPLGVFLSSVAAFSAAATHYWGLASMPFKRAMERYASAPDYDHQLGFTAEADRDISSLARVLAPDTESNPRALAVFVDDLDRCTSTHVVEVVEAMNQIFNSDGRHGCVFVLGLDREVVASNIEVAYEPTVKALAGRPVGDGFGMSFLAKLVQLVVTVPEPSEDGIKRLLARVTRNEIPAREGTVDADEVELVEAEIREQRPGSLEEVSASETRGNVSVAAEEEGRRRVRAERIDDSRDVINAEFELLGYLGRNPRLIKRFDNAFRLQLYVANRDPDCDLDFSLGQLIALGKWVGLRLRWPHLAEILDDEPALIELLERTANGQGKPNSISTGEEIRLREAYKSWFVNREVTEFLRDREEGTRSRVTALRPGSFLQVS